MADDSQQPIIVKRIKKVVGGGHGGAWKIAYADFVTAMMAFFILMWLLGSTAQGDLEGIAEYFQNPMKMSINGGEGSGDSSSIIKGGGTDLSRKLGQVRKGDTSVQRATNADASRRRQSGGDISDAAAVEQAKRRERARLIDLKGRIEALIEADTQLQIFRNQILIDIIAEGLRIQLVDEHNRPMFDISSDTVKPYTRALLRAIGRALNDVDNRISLSGHTDAAQYGGGGAGFSNWELSANRANSARRELVIGGLNADKVVRVVGLADTIPLQADDPLDPINRRISIIVLNKEAEEEIRKDGTGHSTETAVQSADDAETLGRNIEQNAVPFGR
ncbi:flagellar motor protein MotB [Betaproteobacteria bacterium]|nr:flagellar motor protein MotB [Betaproteobacteria bacterium]GHT93356.1 flagellar motor protein MotB [Betaproteobacteria bacterium]GHU11093.1 flagellar motor protein MotB [Betaproteobacteria bacterium]GHU20847.1 flagellar motor protein MotB [Betaproteobacteria bacterium]